MRNHFQCLLCDTIEVIVSRYLPSLFGWSSCPYVLVSILCYGTKCPLQAPVSYRVHHGLLSSTPPICSWFRMMAWHLCRSLQRSSASDFHTVIAPQLPQPTLPHIPLSLLGAPVSWLYFYLLSLSLISDSSCVQGWGGYCCNFKLYWSLIFSCSALVGLWIMSG